MCCLHKAVGELQSVSKWWCWQYDNMLQTKVSQRFSIFFPWVYDSHQLFWCWIWILHASFFFWLQLLKSKLTAFLSDMKWRGFGFCTVGWRKKQSEDVTLGSGQLWLVFFTFSWCFIDRPVNYSKLHYYSILLLPSAWKAWRTVTTANNSGNECLYHNLIHFCDWQSKMWGGTDLPHWGLLWVTCRDESVYIVFKVVLLQSVQLNYSPYTFWVSLCLFAHNPVFCWLNRRTAWYSHPVALFVSVGLQENCSVSTRFETVKLAPWQWMNEGGGVVYISYKEEESEKINVIFLLRFYVQAFSTRLQHSRFTEQTRETEKLTEARNSLIQQDNAAQQKGNIWTHAGSL